MPIRDCKIQTQKHNCEPLSSNPETVYHYAECGNVKEKKQRVLKSFKKDDPVAGAGDGLSEMEDGLEGNPMRKPTLEEYTVVGAHWAE